MAPNIILIILSFVRITSGNTRSRIMIKDDKAIEAKIDLLAKSNPKIIIPTRIIMTFRTAFVSPTVSLGNTVERTIDKPDTPPAAMSCWIKKKYNQMK